jgi:hypothetical protein
MTTAVIPKNIVRPLFEGKRCPRELFNGLKTAKIHSPKSLCCAEFPANGIVEDRYLLNTGARFGSPNLMIIGFAMMKKWRGYPVTF